EIKDVGSPIRRSAARARRLPAAARASSRVRRTDTSANSAPTKKLFAATKNRTPTSLMAALIVVPGVISRASRVSSLLAGSSMRRTENRKDAFGDNITQSGATHRPEALLHKLEIGWNQWTAAVAALTLTAGRVS